MPTSTPTKVMRTGSVVHFLERLQPLLGLGLGIAVVDEKHRHKTQRNEQRSIREQDTVVDLSHERTGDDGRNDLRSHGGRVVIACEFADVRSLAHLNDHGKRVDVDRSPCKADEGEDNKHDGVD